MSAAQVTEAHIELARTMRTIFANPYRPSSDAAPFIADSEARALSSLAMVTAASADRNVSLRLERDQLRAVFPKILAALGNGACCAPDVSVEFIQSIPNEVAEVIHQLRAEVEAECLLNGKGAEREADLRGRLERAEREVERLKSDGAASAFITMSCRASRAEAELKRYTDAVDAQPWASDLPIRVLLDQITSELLTQRNLLMADTEAQAELAAERAIVSRIWTQLGSPTYKQLKGRSIYCLIDELKAELATERARLDAMVANCWVVHSEIGGSFSVFSNACGDYIATAQTYRAAIDAAMEDYTK